jgi:processive 1,2-diacylglycerol beta-glucosyltransferase
MKALILSTATGQGHNSAALAVAESLRARGCRAAVLDVLKLKNVAVSGRVSRLYAGVTIHAPRFFQSLYRIGECVSSPGGRSPIYFLNTLYAAELRDEILRFRPDVIVCTHIFSAQAVTCLRKRYGIATPAVGIATDYTCIPFWEESALDGYVIPSPKLAEEFAARGVPAEKLVPIGIPVRPVFLTHAPKEEARRLFGLTAPHIFLVMGGSMGYGEIDRMAEALAAAMPDSQTVVLCGTNEKLRQRMKPLRNVIAMRYTDRVGDLMDAADVVLTKPGGLSSTEAIAKRVPTVLTRPIPGCEQRNAEFLSGCGAAAYAGSVQSAVLAAGRLAFGKHTAQKMVCAQERLRPGETDGRISDYLISLAGCSGGRLSEREG